MAMLDHLFKFKPSPEPAPSLLQVGSRTVSVQMVRHPRARRYVMRLHANGIVRLTEEGRETAYHTALRHHLIERMLSEIFGMEWHQIHEEAERLEHAVSHVFEAKLRERLGEGGACPHGNFVIPESPAQRKQRGELPLSEAVAGHRYIVTSLHERDPTLLLFLHGNGLGPGQSLRVVSQNYDQTVSIELPAGVSILGRPAAEAVWLRPESTK